jgi:hypothetical protein
MTAMVFIIPLKAPLKVDIKKPLVDWLDEPPDYEAFANPLAFVSNRVLPARIVSRRLQDSRLFATVWLMPLPSPALTDTPWMNLPCRTLMNTMRP